MIASLMMYARPETQAAHRRYWAQIRAELARRGIDSPHNLSNDADAFDVWQAPDLVLSQTCGMPYRTRLHGHATLVGTPDFGINDCPAGYYTSPVVVRRDDPRDSLAAFRNAKYAYNAPHSQSGFASIYNMLRDQGWWFADRVQSGGHQASAQMVADGRADIAALDAVTWRMIQKYEGFAAGLKVLAWTPPTPGLPYITARSADAPAIFDAVKAAIGALGDADRETLGILDLVAIPAKDYLAVPNPPEDAA